MNDSTKPETQSINVAGADTHGAMGEQPQPEVPPPGAIPTEVIAEGNRQIEAGAAFFGKPLADCTREELYAAVIMGWYDAHAAREELGRLHQQLQAGAPADSGHG